jgi:hypothetical protein
MTAVGRPRRDTQGEEGQQRRDEVSAGMCSLGDEPERMSLEPDGELERDETCGREDRDESCSTLGSQIRGSL